jgi:RNA polymerase sigma factor (sigma-70 family)
VSTKERRERYEVVYRATYPAVVAYVLRRVNHRSDASDVIAETYLTLWRRFDEVPGGDVTLPWIFGVARRTLANQRRGDLRRTALSERLGQALSELPEPTPMDGPDREAIVKALGRLGEDDRDLLFLVGVEALDREQVSVALGVSRAVVRLRLHRARQRFARALVQEGAELHRTRLNVPDPLSAQQALSTQEVTR